MCARRIVHARARWFASGPNYEAEDRMGPTAGGRGASARLPTANDG